MARTSDHNAGRCLMARLIEAAIANATASSRPAALSGK